jgi:hypothetical protein
MCRRIMFAGYRPGRCDHELVRALQRAPGDRALHAQYGAWLRAEGDARGELIDLGLRLLSAPSDHDIARAHEALLAARASTLQNPRWASVLRLTWSLGFVRSALFSPAGSTADEASAGRGVLGDFLRHPSAQLLETLEITTPLSPEAAQDCLKTCKKHAAPTLHKVALTLRPYRGEPAPDLDSLTRGLPFVASIHVGAPVERPQPWRHPMWVAALSSKAASAQDPAQVSHEFARRRARTLRLVVLAVVTALLSWWLRHRQ